MKSAVLPKLWWKITVFQKERIISNFEIFHRKTGSSPATFKKINRK
ncbi:hypothetical protein X975_04683, partial [Stegodyphus mimosarum]